MESPSPRKLPVSPKRYGYGGIDVGAAPWANHQDCKRHCNTEAQGYNNMVCAKGNATAPYSHHEGGTEKFPCECSAHKLVGLRLY